MKPVTKPCLVLSLIVLVAVSCGPVTPASTPANTSTPSFQTPQLLFTTSTQIATLTLTPTPMPQPGAEDYRLKSWSANDDFYLDLAEKLSQEFYVGFNNNYQRYGPVFQAEKLLRQPSSDWHDTAWKIVANYPKGISLPEMRPGQDMLAFLMEDLLNNEKISLEELAAIVQDRIQMHWECYPAKIAESPLKQGNYLVVNNLFGDQQNGWIFYTGSCEGTAIYVLRSVDGQYRVEKLRDWQALEIPFAGYSLELDMVGDVNNNGVPEVVVNVSYGASGTPSYRGQNMEFYEWDLSSETFVSDRTQMFEEMCFIDEPCNDGWRIERTTIQGIHPVIVNELHLTMTDGLEGASACDYLVIEHTYLWKNGKFIEQTQTLAPPTDERIECRLSWALQVLERKRSEIAFATETISGALLDWPNGMNEMWGPASKDYFAFRLGLAYDMTNQEELALEAIRGVAEDPANPEFDFIPQLASRYLEVRSQYGKMEACQEINLLQTESEYQINDNLIFVPVNKLIEAWGVGPALWSEGRSIRSFCDEEGTLQGLLELTHGSEHKDFEEWLTEVGLEPVRVKPIYESYALNAWLVSLPAQSLHLVDFESRTFERSDYQEIWLFTESSHGMDALYIDGITFNTEALVDFLSLDRQGTLVTVEVLHADVPRFYVFHVKSDGNIQSQFEDFYVDGSIDHEAKEILTIAGSYGSEQPEVAVYRWNTDLEKLDKRIINFDFARDQDEVAQLVFQEHDYEQAILYINKFLIQAPPEPKEFLYCHYSDCTYYPDWYRPYMRYLLALAYELSGRQEQARDAYFLLWKDYPDNGFGLAAEHRLTQRRP